MALLTKNKKTMINSGTVDERLDLIKAFKRERIMSAKLERMLEDLSSELKKKTSRPNIKIATLIQGYRKHASEREQSIIKHHILPAIGKTSVAQLNVKEFCESHLGKPVSSAKKILKCFERIMQEHDEGFKLPKVIYRNKGRKWTEEHILTLEQVKGVIERVHQPYRVLCWISVYTALRLGNVVNLTPAEVDLKGGWVKVIQTKTGNPVTIPISDPLHKVLAGIKPWPFDGSARFFNVDAKAVSTSVRRAFHRCGIEWGSFHHFRHHAASRLINAGVELAVVRDILGHKDFRSTLIYARIEKETLKQAVRAFNG